MNKLSINNVRLGHGTAGALILCSVVLTISALLAERPNSPASTSTPTPEQWPSLTKRDKVKEGFMKALNRSAKEETYRNQLKDFAKQDVVRTAVQEEMRKVSGLEQETIPNEIVMIFYEPQTGEVHKFASAEMKEAQEKNENRNLHVFYLPPYNPQDTTDHKYDNHLKCCYRPW